MDSRVSHLELKDVKVNSHMSRCELQEVRGDSRASHPELEEVARRAFGHLESAVSDAHARGSIAGDPRAITLLAWSVVHGLSSLILDGQARVPAEEPVVRALAEHLGQLLFDGIRTRP